MGLGLVPGITASLVGAAVPAPAPAPLAFNDRLVFEGDSEFATSSGVQAYPSLIVPKIGGKLRMPVGWNQATGGQTTTQMVTQIASVNATNPNLVVLLAGTNDDKSSDAAAATTISNLQQMVKSYTSRFVVIGTILPRFGASAMGAAQEKRRQEINAAIRAMASNRVRVVDGEVLGLTASDFIDGLHPNQFGSHKVSTAFAAAINELLDPAADPLALYKSPTNVLFARGKDTSFSKGGGTVDNTGAGAINGITTAAAAAGTSAGIPLGWIVTNPTSLSITVTRVDRGDGTFGCRIQASGTAAAAGRIQLRTTITRSPAAVAGQTNEQWVGFDQAANEQGVGSVGMLSTSSLDWTPGRSQDTGFAKGPGLPAMSGVLRTAQQGSYGTSGLTSFTQYIEIFVQPGTVIFDRTFYKPYAALVTAG
jgi:lysophospholipase L1-like esterase